MVGGTQCGTQLLNNAMRFYHHFKQDVAAIAENDHVLQHIFGRITCDHVVHPAFKSS